MGVYDINGNTIATKGLSNYPLISFDRIEGTSYYFIRIPRKTYDGSIIIPKVGITSDSGNVSDIKHSALEYATTKKPVFCINAGLFTTQNNIELPLGFTVVNGVSITNTPMTSQSMSNAEGYPLCIYDNGDMDTPYWDRSSCDTAVMISEGVKYAVTAWGTMIYNCEKTGIDKFNETVHVGERIPQQVIGQFQNGDYFICTSDGLRGSIENEVGFTMDEMSDLLISKGVKFAYALDGGGSTETINGQSQLNPIYESGIGRKVPTVIYFDIKQKNNFESNDFILGSFSATANGISYSVPSAQTRALMNPIGVIDLMLGDVYKISLNGVTTVKFACSMYTIGHNVQTLDWRVTEGTAKTITSDSATATGVTNKGWTYEDVIFTWKGSSNSVLMINFKKTDETKFTEDDLEDIRNNFTITKIND